MDLGNLSIYISFFFLVLYLALEAQDLGIGIISSAVSRNQDENEYTASAIKSKSDIGIVTNVVALYLSPKGFTTLTAPYKAPACIESTMSHIQPETV